ncbi:cell division protein FtsK, partial [Enterococcus casseliflavus]
VNNEKNECMIIDGKNSFMAQSGRYASIPTATTAEECLQLLDDAISIMKQRYSEMNVDLSDENDFTYVEKFPRKGSILIACDELLALASATQAMDKLRKPAERLMPQIADRILTLILKSRQASMTVLLSGQAFPASLLGDSIARSNIGLLINLGSITQVQAQELFGRSLKDLPRADTSNFGGLIWLDGLDWEAPKPFLSPYYDDEKLPFKKTLSKLAEAQGGGLPQA